MITVSQVCKELLPAIHTYSYKKPYYILIISVLIYIYINLTLVSLNYCGHKLD